MVGEMGNTVASIEIDAFRPLDMVGVEVIVGVHDAVQIHHGKA